MSIERLDRAETPGTDLVLVRRLWKGSCHFSAVDPQLLKLLHRHSHTKLHGPSLGSGKPNHALALVLPQSYLRARVLPLVGVLGGNFSVLCSNLRPQSVLNFYPAAFLDHSHGCLY